MTRPKKQMSLVADVGGTNSRVALADGPRVIHATIRRYRNADFLGFESVLRCFIADQTDVEIAAACIAVAGPVGNGCATMTNLDWTIDAETVAQVLRAERVTILNDLQAQGYALDHIPSDSIHAIIPGGAAAPRANRLVIGVGTGFNAACVYETDAGRIVAASESGQVTLPVRDETDLRLCRHISQPGPIPAVEDVLSGPGLERIYAWMGAEAGDPRTATAKHIMADCADGGDARAVATARYFTRMLGTVVGNLALIHLPFGGIFLVGGVARAFEPFLTDLGFVEAFRDKGRFASFMSAFGVSLIEDDDAALTGAARHLARLLADPVR